jgi:hypothetical protein
LGLRILVPDGCTGGAPLEPFCDLLRHGKMLFRRLQPLLKSGLQIVGDVLAVHRQLVSHHHVSDDLAVHVAAIKLHTLFLAQLASHGLKTLSLHFLLGMQELAGPAGLRTTVLANSSHCPKRIAGSNANLRTGSVYVDAWSPNGGLIAIRLRAVCRTTIWPRAIRLITVRLAADCGPAFDHRLIAGLATTSSAARRLQFLQEGRVILDHLLGESLYLRVRRPFLRNASQSNLGLASVNQAVRNVM